VFVDGVTPLNAVNMNKLQTRDEKNAVNGYPGLDGSGKVPVGQLPAIGAQLTYEGDWAAPTTYDDGDVVVKDGIAYLCVGGPTTTPPDPQPWGAAAIAKPSYGTTLPATPVDGQEHILVDSLTAPSYQWRFRYNAGSASAYKWEFVGGFPKQTEVGDSRTLTVSTWTNIGPTWVPPRAGVYLIESWLNELATTAGLTLYQGIGKITDNGAPSGRSAMTVASPVPMNGGYHSFQWTLTPSDTMTVWVFVTATQTNVAVGRAIRITPRVVA